MLDLLTSLKEIVGEDSVLTGISLSERATSYWDSSPTEALMLAKPKATQEVSEILRVCNNRNQSVIFSVACFVAEKNATKAINYKAAIYGGVIFSSHYLLSGGISCDI